MMTQNTNLNTLSIPLLYHPTNVLLLDDNRKFLNDISFIFNESIPLVLETNPQHVLQHLASHTYRSDELASKISKQHFDTVYSNHSSPPELFEVSFLKLAGALDTPNRYKRVVTVFIDKMMPGMDGLDFCKKVREAEYPVKLILFTGKAGLKEAVDAFNEGLIDAYLSKDDQQLHDKINQLYTQSSWQQFIELSHIIGGFVSHQMKPLHDPQFCGVFERVREKYRIIEFYAIDTSCSFLMLDENAHATLFLVRNENDFNEAHDMAKNSKAAYEVIQALRERQLFPISKGSLSDYYHLSGDQWDDVMKPVSKIPGREWYYTVIDSPWSKKGLSFHKYRREIWPTP